MKDYENALKDFHRLNKLSKTTAYPWGENIYFLMGICHQGIGNYDSAVVYYDKFVASEKIQIIFIQECTHIVEK
ncbi:hypothetical protein OBJ92_07610 [Empedobacter falsenii]